MTTTATSSSITKRLLQGIRQKPLWMKGVGVIIIVAIIFFGVKKLTTPSATTPTYQTGQVEKGDLIVSLSASGQVSAANSGAISTNASGVVSKVYVQNGQQVKSGAPIAQLTLDQDAQQRFAQANAALQGARNSLAGAQSNLYSLQSKEFAANQKFMNDAVERDLDPSDPTYVQQNADWLAAESSYVNQQHAIAQAQASLRSAQLAYNQASPTVYAPIAGTVTGLSLQVGSVLTTQSSSTGTQTSQKIASIQTAAAPMVTVNLTEIDIPKVKIGNSATLTFDAFPGKTYTGKIVSIDTSGTTSSGVTNYPAVIQLDTQESGLYSNMTASANIITLVKNNVLLVPTTAVTTANGESTVRIMKDGQQQVVTVTVGSSSDTQTEISSGLSEGDTIITSITTTGTAKNSTGTSVFSSLGRQGSFGGSGQVRSVQISR